MSVENCQRHRALAEPGSPGAPGAASAARRLRMRLTRITALHRARERAAAFVRRHRPDVGDDEVLDLSMVLDELACNAMRHARPPCEVVVSLRGDRVLIQVSDSSPEPARFRDAYDGGGRGLALIDALADRWGQTRLAGGKTVWAELALGPAPG